MANFDYRNKIKPIADKMSEIELKNKIKSNRELLNKLAIIGNKIPINKFCKIEHATITKINYRRDTKTHKKTDKIKSLSVKYDNGFEIVADYDEIILDNYNNYPVSYEDIQNEYKSALFYNYLYKKIYK